MIILRKILPWVMAVLLIVLSEIYPTNAWYNPGRMLCGGSANQTFAASSTGFVGLAVASATESTVQLPLGVQGTAVALYVHSGVPPAGVTTYVYTAVLAGSPQTMTCTITGSAQDCKDVSHSFTFTAGQLFDLKVVSSASAATSRHSFCLGYTNP